MVALVPERRRRQQRDIEHEEIDRRPWTTRLSLPVSLDARLNNVPHWRMDDGVERVQLRLVLEDTSRKLGTLEVPVDVEHRVSESAPNLPSDCLRLKNLMGDNVGVDRLAVFLTEEPSDGALA